MLLHMLTVPLTSASLVDCTDAGPWPCDEEGCPEPLIGCAHLHADGLCAHTFADVFDEPPAGKAETIIHSACPATCGHCGVPVPETCNMVQLDAATLSAEELAQALVDSEAPVIVENAMQGWRRAC